MCFCCFFIGREEFSFICLHGASGFGFVFFGGVFLLSLLFFISLVVGFGCVLLCSLIERVVCVFVVFLVVPVLPVWVRGKVGCVFVIFRVVLVPPVWVRVVANLENSVGLVCYRWVYLLDRNWLLDLIGGWRSTSY